MKIGTIVLILNFGSFPFRSFFNFKKNKWWFIWEIQHGVLVLIQASVFFLRPIGFIQNECMTQIAGITVSGQKNKSEVSKF